MKFIKTILAVMMLPLLTLTACSNDDDDPVMIYNAFVTYTGNTGNTATFTTQEKDDSDLITFTAEVNNNIGLVKGKRYVIAYTTFSGKRLESGPIDLYQILTPFQDETKEASLEDIKAMKEAPYTATPGRTGYYINVPATADFMPKTFCLYVDKATLAEKLPDVYIVFEADDTKPAQKGTYLGSFSVEKYFTNANCDGIRLHYKQDNTEKVIEFRKGTQTIKPAE